MEISELSFLVVVENEREALMIRDVLESMNARDVTIAENGLAALKRIQRSPDYFVLADWNISGINGLKLLREIRSSKRSAATPCVLIISRQSQKEIEQAKALNVTGFLKKASTPETFMSEFLSLLGEKNEPLLMESLIEQGEALLESGDAEEAFSRFKQAVQSGRSRLANLHTDMGLVFKRQGRIDEAIHSFEQAVEADPLSARSHATRGDAYRSAGRLKEAESSLKKAVALDPSNHEAKVNLADTYLQQDANARAEEVYKNILKSEPDDIYVLNRLGIAYRKQKKYDQALTHYHNALKINNRDKNLYFNLGRCYYEMDRFGEAEKFMRLALAINPNFEEAAEFLAKLKKPGP